MAKILEATPTRPPTPARKVAECWVVLYPDQTSECYSVADYTNPERAKIRAVAEADACVGAIILHYQPPASAEGAEVVKGGGQ